jgi:hypothetical protein
MISNIRHGLLPQNGPPHPSFNGDHQPRHALVFARRADAGGTRTTMRSTARVLTKASARLTRQEKPPVRSAGALRVAVC